MGLDTTPHRIRCRIAMAAAPRCLFRLGALGPDFTVIPGPDAPLARVRL